MDPIDRTVLPMPDPEFKGKIDRTLKDSKADWAMLAPVRPPLGAPNVLLVLIDDAGFGNPETFGGPVETPNLTRVADAGLRYNRFHVTAVCSPTRAATLTGRNHHSVGFGSLGELPGPFPGYSAQLPKSCAPVAKTLQMNGYCTSAFGKWHLTPDHVQGPAGPFDRWPNAWGFDYFWGFLGGEAGQFDPVITENNTAIGVPEDKDFYFPDAMADKAIEWLHGVRAQDEQKPFFMYFSTGCLSCASSRPQALGRQVRGPVRRGLGPLPRGDVRAPEEARRRPGGRGAHGPERRDAGLGLADGRAEEALRPADGGLRGLPGERGPQRRPAARRVWRSWASSTTRS